jgi:hypothetical protein
MQSTVDREAVERLKVAIGNGNGIGIGIGYEKTGLAAGFC